MDANTPTTTPPPASEDKTVAILSYLTLLGFIVAIVLNSSKKTKLGAYHLRQTLGLILTSIVGWIVAFVVIIVVAFIPFVGLILIPLIWICFVGSVLTLWVMGLIAAINGNMKPMPVVGPLYQKWFGTAFD
jgi:uncharacterized membrane protein